MANLQRDDRSDFDLTLLSNFIHQVVNPLNGVAGTLDNLIEGTISEGRRDQRLRAARAQLEECVTLVRNLAYFSAGFASVQPSAKKTIVVPQTLIEAAMFFQENAENRGIRIQVVERNDRNTVPGRPELLRQVFMNLFDNAVKYCKENSEVIVHQRIQKTSNHVLITIDCESTHDISKAEMDKLFELGFRGENAKKVTASGTGLGLYICKKIVEDVHGGRMRAEVGAHGLLRFLIYLPRS